MSEAREHHLVGQAAWKAVRELAWRVPELESRLEPESAVTVPTKAREIDAQQAFHGPICEAKYPKQP